MFSSRLRRGAGRNRLAVALDRRRSAGLPIIDLTESNPTHAGFDYPSTLLTPLGQPGGRRYDPNPVGLLPARQAVSNDFQRRGVTVPPERIVLTASTSEAYSLLFKLLCDPGDAVLVPRPSYPLVEHLTDLDAVAVENYSLHFHGRWSIDVDAIGCSLADAGRAAPIRAIVAVSPNNPTGSVVAPAELNELTNLARGHKVALIVDEVFSDYPIDDQHVASALAHDEALTFGLGGLSKSVGLPQVKLGWIGVSGPELLVREALDRIATIGDMYLSVSTPVQLAAADLLENGACVRAQIQRRVCENYRMLREAVPAYSACSVLPVEAGWYAVVQIPAVQPEETLVVELVERSGLLVHPGYFFDFEREAFLVLSLLAEPAVFAAGIDAMFAEIERRS